MANKVIRQLFSWVGCTEDPTRGPSPSASPLLLKKIARDYVVIEGHLQRWTKKRAKVSEMQQERL